MFSNSYYFEVMANEKMSEIEGHMNQQRLLNAARQGRRPRGRQWPAQLYLLVPVAFAVALIAL